MAEEPTPCPGCKNGEETINFVRAQLDMLTVDTVAILQRIIDLKADLARFGFPGKYKEYDESVQNEKCGGTEDTKVPPPPVVPPPEFDLVSEG